MGQRDQETQQSLDAAYDARDDGDFERAIFHLLNAQTGILLDTRDTLEQIARDVSRASVQGR